MSFLLQFVIVSYCYIFWSCYGSGVLPQKLIGQWVFTSDSYLAALLLKLEKRISEVPIQSKELGYTKPGAYIYELLADLNITSDTVPMIINIIEEATLLIEEDNQQNSKRNVCRLEIISDILNTVFRDISNAKSYRVSWHIDVLVIITGEL